MAMLRPAFLALTSLLLLTSCDSMPNWLGSEESTAPKVAGERVAVLGQDITYTADATLADTLIELAPAERLADWPQHSGNAAGYATSLELTGDLSSTNSTSIGDGEAFHYKSVIAPVIADGTIFAMDAQGSISAHAVTDIDHKIWTSPGVANPDETAMLGGGLAYDQGKLFAVSGNGLVVAFEPASGRELWRQDIRIPIRAAPLAAGNRVFIVTSDSKLFTLDAATGSIVWEDQGISEGASFLATAAPTYHNGLLVTPYSSAELRVLTADEGLALWSDTLAMTKRGSASSNFSGIGGAPVIIDNALYAVSTAGVLAAYRLDNGFRVWEQPISSAMRPWISGNAIFVLTTDGHVLALNRLDGRIYWVHKLPAYKHEEKRLDAYQWSGPVLAGETLYIAGSHGVLKRINATNGDELADIDIPDNILSSPIIAGGHMYFVSQDASLISLH